MVGFTNKCPKCGERSSFTPEEMECDKSLVLWCNHCKEYINQTLTLETLRRWWANYEAGETNVKPPVNKNMIENLELAEKMIANDPDCFLDRVEIHLKDFTGYGYKEDVENEVQNNS